MAKKLNLKQTLKKKLQRKLTYRHQSNKIFKNQWPIRRSRFFIKSLGYGTLDTKKIEVARILLRKVAAKDLERTSKFTKILLNTSLNRVFTKKSSNQRMGKGKGNVKGRFSTVYPGKVLFEMRRGDAPAYDKVAKLLSNKLSFKVKSYGRKNNK